MNTMTETSPASGTAALSARAQEILRRPKVRKTAWWVGGTFVAIGVFGFLAAPPIAKSILEDKLGEALHRKVSIDKIAINPYVLSAKIDGFSVKTAEGLEVVGFDSLYINLQASSIFRGGPVVEEVKLDGPRVRVTRIDEDRYDISDLIDEWSKPSDSPTPRFAVNNIQVSGGKVNFIDKPASASHEIADIALRLPFVSSLPYQTDIYVEPHFSARINGSPLVLEGRSKPFKDSLESELSIDLDQFDLVRYLAYSPVKLPFSVKSATLFTEMKLLFSQGNGQPATTKLVGALHLKDLALQDGDRPLLAWKQLDVTIQEADLLKRHFAIDSVRLAGLENHLRVTPQGTINWLDIAERLQGPSPAPAVQPAKGAAPAQPVTWSVREVTLADGSQTWRDDSRSKPLEVTIKDLQVTARNIDDSFAKPLEVDAAWTIDGGERIRMKQGSVKGARIDVAKRTADLGEIDLAGIDFRVTRDKQGGLDLPQPPLLRATKAAATDATPWMVGFRKLALSESALRYEDQGLKDKAAEVIDSLAVSVEDFSTAPGKRAILTVNGRVNQKGNLKVAGDVQMQPLAINADVDITGLPLLPVQPYFADRLNVTLVRGQISAKGKVALNDTKEGLAGGYKGQLTLGDLHTIDKVNSTDLLKWKSLYVGNIDAKLLPFALNVGEIALSDFYARMIVTPEGKLNLSQIVRKPEDDKPVGTLAPATAKEAAQPAPTPATPVVAAAPAAPAKPMPPIRIGKVTLQNGTVNFSDFFVKPNYTVNVTKITGRVNGLSSAADTLADLELRGSYGNAAPVEVTAKLNPLAAKAYLDLKGEIRGVDLTTLSTYAGKYAGYAIDKGKLSLYVTYKLADNKLNAENRVFLDQLTFGDKVDSPDATSLPVKLAVALLKNGRGEIDINLPISGSLDDPQFSVGGIIVKVIVNLFVKAVTSPFALLGSLFGGGEELSNVEFDVGYAALTAAGSKKLEALAKAMNDRPALKLEVTGRIDPDTDREGAKRAAIDRAVKAEKLKDLVKKGVEGTSVEAVAVDAKEYPEYLQRAYKAAKFPKPRNLIGLQKDLPVDEMEKLMLANLPVTDDDLRLLAERRAGAVQAWLLEQGKVPAERIFLMPPKLAKDDKGDGKAGFSRVDFSLR